MSRERGFPQLSALNQRKAELEHVRGQRLARIQRLDAEIGTGPATVEAVVHDARAALVKESTEASVARISNKVDAVDQTLMNTALDQLRGLAERGTIPASVYERRIGEMQAIYGGSIATPLQSGEPGETAPEAAAIVPGHAESPPLESTTVEPAPVSGNGIEPAPVESTPDSITLTPPPGMTESTLSPLRVEELKVSEDTQEVSSDPDTLPSPVIENGKQVYRAIITTKKWSNEYSFALQSGRNVSFDILLHLHNHPGMSTTYADIQRIVNPDDPDRVGIPASYIGNLYTKFDDDPKNPSIILKEGVGRNARLGLNPEVTFSFLSDGEPSSTEPPVTIESIDETAPTADERAGTLSTTPEDVINLEGIQALAENSTGVRYVNITSQGQTSETVFDLDRGIGTYSVFRLFADNPNHEFTAEELEMYLNLDNTPYFNAGSMINNLRVKLRPYIRADIVKTLKHGDDNTYKLADDIEIAFLESLPRNVRNTQPEVPSPYITQPSPVEAPSELPHSSQSDAERDKSTKSVVLTLEDSSRQIDFRIVQGRNINYALLRHLFTNPGFTTTFQDLQNVINPNYPHMVDNVWAYINGLQKKVGDDPQEPSVILRRGVGKNARFGLNPDAEFSFPDESPDIPEELISGATDLATLPASAGEVSASKAAVDPVPIPNGVVVVLPGRPPVQELTQPTSAHTELVHLDETQKKISAFDAASLCQMLEYFDGHSIAVNGDTIRFNPGSEIDTLLDTFLDQLPEQPVEIRKNANGSDKEKYESKYRLLNRVERMLKPDLINEIIDMNDGPVQELLISLYTIDQDVFAGNLIPFLRSVTMQNQAYFEKKRDEKPGPWHAPAPMVAHYHARQAREAAASNGNGHSANGTEELAESVSVFTLPIEHRSTPKKVTAQR